MTLGERARAMGDAVRAARLRLAQALLEAEQGFALHADTSVPLTPRTDLTLHAGRVYLCRRGRDPIRLTDACLAEPVDVPASILLLAAKALPDLVDPEAP